MTLAGGQVISTSPGAYIMDNAAPHPVSQTARASPATVSQQHPADWTGPLRVNALSLPYVFIDRCSGKCRAPVSLSSVLCLNSIFASCFAGLSLRRELTPAANTQWPRYAGRCFHF